MNPTSNSSPPAAILQLLAGDVASGNGSLVVRGMIAEISSDGELIVQLSADPSSRVRCDLLDTGLGPPPEFSLGDVVLLTRPASTDVNGCVLGRITRYRRNQPPSRVVVEAGDSLTLKCGDSEIDLRKDGKLLIRGRDVVSRASRTQRIKGGTVAIN